jgi:hypothetical protein
MTSRIMKKTWLILQCHSIVATMKETKLRNEFLILISRMMNIKVNSSFLQL